MAHLNTPIDTTGIDTTSTFDNLPEGWYQCIIATSDELPNSKNTGRMIMLELTIGSGKYSGRTVKTWLNYQHPSAKAQEIALKQLAKLMEVLRLTPPLKDTTQLHAKPFEALIGIDGTYNNVQDFRPYKATAADLRPTSSPASTEGFADMEEPEWAKNNG